MQVEKPNDPYDVCIAMFATTSSTCFLLEFGEFKMPFMATGRCRAECDIPESFSMWIRSLLTSEAAEICPLSAWPLDMYPSRGMPRMLSVSKLDFLLARDSQRRLVCQKTRLNHEF
jgi:hypothetical protein